MLDPPLPSALIAGSASPRSVVVGAVWTTATSVSTSNTAASATIAIVTLRLWPPIVLLIALLIFFLSFLSLLFGLSTLRTQLWLAPARGTSEELRREVRIFG